jgi:hypothetical protein
MDRTKLEREGVFILLRDLYECREYRLTNVFDSLPVIRTLPLIVLHFVECSFCFTDSLRHLLSCAIEAPVLNNCAQVVVRLCFYITTSFLRTPF